MPLVVDYIDTNSTDVRYTRIVRASNIKQWKFEARDILAMSLKFLLSKAELKDIHVQFGVPLTSFKIYIGLGIKAIVVGLIDYASSKVFWDRSTDGLKRCADRTKDFLDIPNIVGMIDGDKISSKAPQDVDSQNRDYDGWTKDVHHNVVLVWDPFGKIVDCGVNAPGSFHDSKITLWCRIYDHIKALPSPYHICCDNALYTRGNLHNKIVKCKEEYKEGKERDEYDKSLTHLRQCSKWGSNVLTGCF